MQSDGTKAEGKMGVVTNEILVKCQYNMRKDYVLCFGSITAGSSQPLGKQRTDGQSCSGLVKRKKSLGNKPKPPMLG